MIDITRIRAEKSLQKRIIAACGNDCSACPRYVAHPFEKTEEEYERLKKAFFEKEKSLSEIRGSFLGDGGYSEDVKEKGEE